ncbi:hypothetical protein HAZT_HAZT005725 [Hyalella azteca]|uniref:Uncharacterized protein n=1 Tax=Hyalella azteca TaxID=294128 RepID=A0A6A0H3I6_HYAAZ|nr:hypothetical protein HAZT_HAZT005725 [Hyalella azteca]
MKNCFRVIHGKYHLRQQYHEHHQYHQYHQYHQFHQYHQYHQYHEHHQYHQYPQYHQYHQYHQTAIQSSECLKLHNAYNVLVFDMGAGKLDVSLLRVDYLEVRVLAASGDEDLGGDYLD